MNPKLLTLLFASLLISACTPSDLDSESASRVSSPREANIERYLQKAKENNSLALERSKPLPVTELTGPDTITNVMPVRSPVSLPDEMQQSKDRLEARVRAAYGQEASQKAGALILEYHENAVQAVKDAQSPEDMARRLQELDTAFRERLNAFLKNEQANVWLRPTQAQLDAARAEMDRKNASMLSRLSTVYGPVCAQKIKPVLQESAESYLLAMAGAKDQADLDRRVADISARGDAQIQELIDAYGDPAGPAPEEEITAMRARMIAAYQALEERIETLYGKEAVLKVRPLFNQILENASNVARTPTRVSYKKEELARLNKIYQEKISNMQEEFNKQLDAKRRKPSPKSLLKS